ncbi:NADH:ubiquinone oxidoreductase [bacterium]|nr:NADH:ubiquinone oxidoreductase [bacterium]|tara:strand:- start:2767 stop:3549 length:783 start_codon:yes stop_codon:yes gene_type:complete
MKKQKNNPTLAIISLTCCEGCQQTILDLGPRLLDLLKLVDLREFDWTEDEPEPDIMFDLTLIEGSVVSKYDLARLEKIRKKSKKLIAIGACACLGGIPEIKNYSDKGQAIKYVYKNIKNIDNLEIKPLRKYVKIDFEIPGCPPDKDEVFEILKQIIMGRIPAIPKRPVCYECALQNNDCFLLAKKICLGPISLGGCKAVCPSNAYRCEGCRGPIEVQKNKNNKIIPSENTINLLKKLRKLSSQEEIQSLLEKFGMKDDIL